jgi:predicted lipoprotein
MMRPTARFAVIWIALLSTSCVPWTVRPIDSAEGSTATASTLTAAAFVDSIWSAKLLPSIDNAAADLRTFLDAYAKSPSEALSRFGRRESNGATYLSVKGTGRVIAVDTHSKVGLALVDVPPFDGRPDVTIQVGPVMRGTSLRDATGLVRFTDFVNQLQYADVANELNDRVLKLVIAPLPLTSLAGKIVAFEGTATGELSAMPPVRELVPVRLTLQESR